MRPPSARSSLLPTSPEAINQLHRAVLDGDLPTIDRLLAWGVDPSARAERGNDQSPLATLLPRRHGAAIVQRFAQAGVNLHACDRVGNAVLFHALRFCTLHESPRHMRSTVAALLDAGARLDRTGNDRTAGDCYSRKRVYPLDQAVIAGLPEMVQQLLDAGADPNATPDAHGWTALHWAVRGNHPNHRAIVPQLVLAGASEQALDRDGQSPADLARTDRAVEAALWRAVDERRVRQELLALHALADHLDAEDHVPRPRL